MALTVEDGTGIEGADAYVDTDFVDTYAAKFGKTDWDAVATDAAKEIHIRKACQFIDLKYPFDVIPLTQDQGLLFPAKSLYVRGYSVTGLPTQLKDAVAELAIIDVNTNLSDSVVGRSYTYRKVKVGDLEKTERFETDNSRNQFDTVELILRPLLPGVVGTGVAVLKLRRV